MAPDKSARSRVLLAEPVYMVSVSSYGRVKRTAQMAASMELCKVASAVVVGLGPVFVWARS